MSRPFIFHWDGEAMRPLRRFAHLCDKEFVVGELYPMQVHEDRSTNSHNHYFAALADAFENLPEDELERFRTVEHLRKWALIKAGYRDERTIVLKTKAEAAEIADLVRSLDSYAVVLVRDNAMKVYTAQSQSARAMDRKTFQESKDKVLDIVADLVGVSRGDLESHTKSDPSRSRTRPDKHVEAASTDAAGPDNQPQPEQAQTHASPEIHAPVYPSGGDVAGAELPSAPASPDDVLRRFSEALFEVVNGGPRALMQRRKRFGEENRVAADKDKVEAIYSAHLARVAYDQVSDDECRRRVEDAITAVAA